MSSATAAPVVVVTGANQGIGFEIVKLLAADATKADWKILLGTRSEKNGADALTLLGNPKNVSVLQLDVTSAASTQAAFDRIKKEHGRVDILIQNAGIAFMEGTYEQHVATFDVNVYGVKNLHDLFLPLIPEGTGREILVSSEVGAWAHYLLPETATRKALEAIDTIQWPQIDELAQKYLASLKEPFPGKEQWPASKMMGSSYCMSKLFESVYARMLARDLTPKGIVVALVTPGYCRTNLGPMNAHAPRSAEQGGASCLYGLKVQLKDAAKLYHDGDEVAVATKCPMPGVE